MDNFEQYLTENFKWFHRHPELPYQEVLMTAKIKELLEKAGVEILSYPLETGVVAVVRGDRSVQDGPTAALRCDIDALPIMEQTSLSYQSETEGVMHACGHDMHIMTGIGTAIQLQERKRELNGTVRIIFQPAEEEAHGALKVLETGVMDGVSHIWGFHADPTNRVNVVGIREGYVAAAVDRFVIKVTGIGCHGAHPDDGVDSILAASAIVQNLQSVVSRNANAFRPSLLSVTRFTAGTTWNVIPSEAFLEGTVRTMERSDRLLYERRVKEIAERTAQAYGASAVVEWVAGPPAVYNNGRMVKLCEETARRLAMETVPEESSMGGDDFAYYEDVDTMSRELPGCYVKIGVGVGKPIHHPEFQIDTSVLAPAVAYMTELLLGEC